MNNNDFDNFREARLNSKSGSARTFSAILQDIAGHLAEIVRSEIRLARVEMRQDFAQVARASAFLAAGAIFALYALGFVLLGVVYALATSIAPWLAAVIGRRCGSGGNDPVTGRSNQIEAGRLETGRNNS